MSYALTYEKCAALVASSRDKKSKPYGNNTRIVRRTPATLDGETTYGLMLHSTDVLTFYPDGRIKFDSGTWFTNTTKDRMNLGPCGVYQQDNAWYVNTINSDGEYDRENPIPYYDGLTIRVNPDGSTEEVR